MSKKCPEWTLPASAVPGFQHFLFLCTCVQGVVFGHNITNFTQVSYRIKLSDHVFIPKVDGQLHFDIIMVCIFLANIHITQEQKGKL